MSWSCAESRTPLSNGPGFVCSGSMVLGLALSRQVQLKEYQLLFLSFVAAVELSCMLDTVSAVLFTLGTLNHCFSCTLCREWILHALRHNRFSQHNLYKQRTHHMTDHTTICQKFFTCMGQLVAISSSVHGSPARGNSS